MCKSARVIVPADSVSTALVMCFSPQTGPVTPASSVSCSRLQCPHCLPCRWKTRRPLWSLAQRNLSSTRHTYSGGTPRALWASQYLSCASFTQGRITALQKPTSHCQTQGGGLPQSQDLTHKHTRISSTVLISFVPGVTIFLFFL